MAALFNLNIDDVHPEGSGGAGDCGGDMDQGVFRHLRILWKRYPRVKVTLFVTPNWQSRRQPLPLRALRLNPRVWRGEPYRLDKHPRWCQWLRGLPNTEIAQHGLTHHALRGHRAQEFQKLSQAEAHFRLHRADEIHQAAGLPHSRGFRPPGWGWNPDLSPVLRKWNCAYIAASGAIHTPPAPHAVSRGEGGIQELPAFHPAWVGQRRPPSGVGVQVEAHEGLLNIPQNWDIHESPPERATAIAKMGGLISAKAHIAPEYDGEPTPNGLTEENIQRLLAALEELEKYEVEYVTLAEAAERWKSGTWRGPG